MDDYAIRVKNVSKDFILPHNKKTSLKQAAIGLVKRDTSYEVQHALKDVSFEIKKGEFFGIVGRNGSGKSTLLKIMAGVYTPTNGGIKVNGSLVPFIELGVGFNPELSGRDNVFLNGALLGFSREEMEKMYDEIVAFAELEQFMDQKLKNYSSGMQVRLAFSIAIRAEGDILVLDEVLAVGDSAFQKKCYDYFDQLKLDKRTIVLVTHSMGTIEQFCDRAMILENGALLDVGEPTKIADLYNEQNLKISKESVARNNKKTQKDTESESTGLVAKIVSIETYSPKTGTKKNIFTYNEKIGIRYLIKTYEFIKSPTVGLAIHDKKKNHIFATNTPNIGVKLKDVEPNQTIQIEFIIDNTLGNNIYSISGAVASTNRSETYNRVHDIHHFEVGGWRMVNNITNPDHEIKIKYGG